MWQTYKTSEDNHEESTWVFLLIRLTHSCCFLIILYKGWSIFYKQHLSKWDRANLFLHLQYAHKYKVRGNENHFTFGQGGKTSASKQQKQK